MDSPPHSRSRAASVAIVGGGVIGASIAAHLGERNAGRVVVFEREDRLGTGSTAKAAGGVRLQFTTPANVAFSKYSIAALHDFESRTGVNPDFVQHGYLFLLDRPEDLRTFAAAAKIQRRLGAPVEVMPPEDAARILPGVRLDGLVGATFCPEDGVATPAALVAGYAAVAKRCGVELRKDAEVTRVVPLPNDSGFEFEAGGESWTCDFLVNAAGPWARGVAALAGIDEPVVPVRRQFFVTTPLAGIPGRMPLTIDWGSGTYMHPHGGGMLVGSSDPDEPPGFSQTPDLDALADVAADAARRLPLLEAARMRTAAAGLYEVSPDHNAILGPAPGLERFILANGFSGHGMQHAPAVGRAIAELILDGASETLDIAPFSMARFRGPAGAPGPGPTPGAARASRPEAMVV